MYFKIQKKKIDNRPCSIFNTHKFQDHYNDVIKCYQQEFCLYYMACILYSMLI